MTLYNSWKCKIEREQLFLVQQEMTVISLMLQQTNKRSVWVDEMFKERDTKSEFILVDELLSRSDEEKFRQYARMTPDQFFYLLQQLTPVIQKQHTNFRKPISPKQRLILTLRFLATGSSQKQLS
uniref:uncharacterized protein LOC104266219 n=1 Tax=Ciona intestinalis TaxID=7719 RepID=UPI0005215EBD|nr:uncharacterized protein LOC104266219 [Ciona intestinalis]|eukprot:XP_009860200.1 uncharacterized protein LOC104266219 [Ciona intestinalis]